MAVSDALKGDDHSEPAKGQWRRQCGCLKTSDKLKELLKCFPSPPPPPPTPVCLGASGVEKACVSAYCSHLPLNQTPLTNYQEPLEKHDERQLDSSNKLYSSKSWGLLTDFVQVVHMSVMATALAFYYIIYCYMQMIYYTLRSALFFHNADGTMKITIGVVTLTSVVVGINLISRMERLFGISWWKY